eukprot:GHVN01042775.1.p1 GENE.GHVN01042775.1~~GHVN01042775.1.p1  ORF type:complete len:620 (+),score=87.62 GHVN01042775.1:2126-3985(+)
MSSVVFGKQKKQEEALSLVQQCERIADYCSVIPGVLEQYISPLLDFLKEADCIQLVRALVKQGGVLCEIINILKGNIIEDIEPWKGVPITDETFVELQKTKRNVERFLGVCKEDLYMTDEQLFTSEDAFKDDLSSLSVVVKPILSLLNRIKSVGKVNFVKKLKELPEEMHVSKRLAKKEDESVMEGKTVVEKGSKLDYIVKEIIETERIYVHDLDKFEEQKKECVYSKLFDQKTIGNIFLNIDALLEFQRGFLIEMERRIGSRTIEDMELGGLFVANAEGFKCYEVFCSGYGNASAVVREVEEKLKKVAGIDMENPVREFDSFLIKPTQRICKYPLLLRELLKALPKDSPERENIEKGMKTVEKITASVNEFQRINENLIKAEEIFSAVDDKKACSKTLLGLLKLDERATVFEEKVHAYYCVLYEKKLVFLKEGTDQNILSFRQASSGLAFKGGVAICEIEAVSVLPDDEMKNTLLLVYARADEIKEVRITFKTKEIVSRWNAGILELVSAEKKESQSSLTAAVFGGCLGEFYVLPGGVLEAGTLTAVKSEIIRAAKNDATLEERLQARLGRDTAPSADELDEIRLRIRIDGLWINLIGDADLAQIASGRKALIFELSL